MSLATSLKVSAPKFRPLARIHYSTELLAVISDARVFAHALLCSPLPRGIGAKQKEQRCES
jgi:hypothetical protein